MSNKSFFIYIHDDLSGNPEWKKIGMGMTPYSIVRSRQKFCSGRFSLSYLWFGYPEHIAFLETQFKKKFHRQTGSNLNQINAQTEMFKLPMETIIREISELIATHRLQVFPVALKAPYSASNSGECPFRIPPEDKSYDYLSALLLEKMGSFREIWNSHNTFNEHFTYY